MAAKRIGLALSGGGSKGAFIVGALKALRVKLGVRRFRVISGTSTGALIGTLLATNDFAKLVKIYSNVRTSDLIDPNHSLIAKIAGTEAVLFAAAILGGRAIFDTGKLRAVIRNNADFAKIKQASADTLLIYNTVDLQTGKLVTFNNRDHSAKTLQDALLASSNIPVLTEPVPIERDGSEHQYVDGGVREFLPLRAVFDSGIDLDHVFALSTAPIQPKRGKKRYDDITGILIRTIDLLNGEIASDDVRGANLYNALLTVLGNLRDEVPHGTALRDVEPAVKRSLRHKRAIPITCIGPNRHLDMDPLEFDPAAMRKAMSHGVACAKKVLGRVS